MKTLTKTNMDVKRIFRYFCADCGFRFYTLAERHPGPCSRCHSASVAELTPEWERFLNEQKRGYADFDMNK